MNKSKKDILADYIIKLASSYIKLATCTYEVNTPEYQYLTSCWVEYSDNIVSTLITMDEGKNSIETLIGKDLLDEYSRRSSQISNFSDSDNNSQKVGRYGTTDNKGFGDSNEIPQHNDGLSGYDSGRTGSESSTQRDSREVDKGHSRNVKLKYLTSPDIVIVPLACLVSEDSLLEPLDIVNSVPMKILQSEEFEDGLIVYKDNNNKVFIIESDK